MLNCITALVSTLLLFSVNIFMKTEALDIDNRSHVIRLVLLHWKIKYTYFLEFQLVFYFTLTFTRKRYLLSLPDSVVNHQTHDSPSCLGWLYFQ